MKSVCADQTEVDSGKLNTPAAKSGAVCNYNSDCEAPLVCLQNQCRLQCLEDRDCAAGEICSENRCKLPPANGVGGNGAAGSSGNPGVECVYNSDCPSNLVCLQGQCTLECKGEKDCAPGLLCIDGRCQGSSGAAGQSGAGGQDGGSSGASGQGSGGFPGFKDPCNLNSECTPPLLCINGACVPECITSIDCPAGFCCGEKNICLKGNVCGGGFSGSSGSAGNGGASDIPCKNDAECQDGVFCNGFERCIKGKCNPALKGACDDENPCTQDICNEAQGTCTYVQIGPQDADGDGHFAIECGGDGDDCDDKDPNNFPGNPESCDGKDNNCNSLSDEGVWNLTDVVSTGFYDVTSSYNPGPPPLVALPSGDFLVAHHGSWSLIGDNKAWGLKFSTVQPSLSYESFYEKVDISRPLFLSSSAALDGGTGKTFFAVATSTYQDGTGTGCFHSLYRRLFVGDLQGSTVKEILFKISNVKCASSNPIFADKIAVSSMNLLSNGSDFVFSFIDPLPNPAPNQPQSIVYTGSLNLEGNISGSQPVLPDLELARARAGLPTETVLALSPSNALLAWPSEVGNAGEAKKVVRYALLSTNLGSILAGPFDLEAANDDAPRAATFVGKSFLLVIETKDGDLRIVQLAASSGKILDTYTLPPVGAKGLMPRLATVGNGAMLTFTAHNSLYFGWISEEVSRGVQLKSYFNQYGGKNQTGTVVAVNDKEAVIAWAENHDLKLGRLVCGPLSCIKT